MVASDSFLPSECFSIILHVYGAFWFILFLISVSFILYATFDILYATFAILYAIFSILYATFVSDT